MSAIIKSVSLILLLLLFGAGVAYYAIGASLKPMDAAARTDAPGQFLATSQGALHYRWHGPKGGPIIVMAHGFSTPSFIFEQNAEALAADGFRVLTFDHFGRGWSDRPKAKYTPDFYDRELMDLLDGLGIEGTIGLVGLSMGGPITSEFTLRHSERVSRLFLFVPAGLTLGTQEGSTNDKLLRTPILGEWIWRVFGERILLGDRQYDESAASPAKRLAGDVSQQMIYRGYFDALLSSYRHLPMQGQDALFARLETTGVPVQAVFGTADTTVLIKSADQFETLVPSASVIRIEGGEHGLNYQMSTVTNPLLKTFFAPLLPTQETP